jgi:UPF0271 protein
MKRIDLNCDLGESAGHDAELMALISSANIACGGHAGDAGTMRATVALAQRHGVAIGAHPGFADRENFGRKELTISPVEAAALVRAQVRELQGVAAAAGAAVNHVKLHGALYNLASRDRALARAVVEAVLDCGRDLRMFALAGSELERTGRQAGLRVAGEVFADRTYQADGTLTPRGRPDALVGDAAAAARQVLRMVLEGAVRATDGTDAAVAAETVCVHGDGPHAVTFARQLRDELARAGVAIRAFGS